MSDVKLEESKSKSRSDLLSVRVPDGRRDEIKNLVVERKYVTKDHSITISSLMAEAIDDLLKKYRKDA